MIRSIPTMYKGVKFNSQLEARWAVFFDALNVSWQYEPEGYLLEMEGHDIPYRPDFSLKLYQSGHQECFVEIKGPAPTNIEQLKAQELAVQSGYAVFIFAGPPLDNLYPNSGVQGWRFDTNGIEDTGYTFAECSKCGLIGICFGGYTNELPCPHDTGRGYATAKIQEAAALARRFSGWQPR